MLTRTARLWTIAAAIVAALPVLAVDASDAGATAVPVRETVRKVDTGPAYEPGEVIVRFRPGATSEGRERARRAAAARTQRRMRLPDAEVLRVGGGRTVPEAVAALRRRPEVLYAEPNWIYRVAETMSNDPWLDEQWGLHNLGQDIADIPGLEDADIDAPQAWDTTTGSASVVVAVVDTGVDYNHDDLAGNMWTNTADPDNGVDDDGNGFVDDFQGWDFRGDDKDPHPGSGSVAWHGTHVAGTIGAVGDNLMGVTGVAWNVSIMPLRVCSGSGSCALGHIADAFTYAADMGAHVVNASLGASSDTGNVLRDAIEASPGTLFVVAAGNGGLDGIGDDNDVVPMYPCNSTTENNLICVAATNSIDRRPFWSNYGATSVDLGAPGHNILSTYPNDMLAYADGTSMATPHVAGAAALMYAANPALTIEDARTALLESVDAVRAMQGRTTSGGRLNAAEAVETAAGDPLAKASASPAIGVPSLAVSFDASDSLDLDGTIQSYDWDFGDGNLGSGAKPSHTYTSTGLFDAVVTVTDDAARIDTATVVVAVGASYSDTGGSSFLSDITWLSASAITGGCGGGRFCPAGEVSRGQMAAFLARAFGLPPAGADYFTDDETSIFEDDINRVAEAGIAGGCGGGKFCPGDPVTRAQMASFIMRALGGPPASEDHFSDDGSSTHQDDINALAEAEVTGGCGAGLYCPASRVTRAQMAAFLRRALT